MQSRSAHKTSRPSHVWRHHAARTRNAPEVSPRSRRRKRLRAVLFAGVTCVCVLVCALVAVTHVPSVRIARTTTVGSVALPGHLVQAYVETFDAALPRLPLRRDNSALFPRARLEAGIEESFPRVAAASVAVAGFLAPVRTVTLTERVPFARWCESGGAPCFLTDEAGFIFAYDEGEGVITPIRFSGGEVLASSARIGRTCSPHFRALVDLTRVMERRSLGVQSVFFADGHAVLRMDEGFSVRVPVVGLHPEALISVLELSLASEPLRGKASSLEYIDLRFGNRVYYRFAHEGDISTLHQEALEVGE